MARLQVQSTNYFPGLRGGAEPMQFDACPENPLALLQDWASHVLSIEAVEPMFVTLATASGNGIPSARTVQLLGVDDEAMLFTTNFGSRKGVEMQQTGRAAVAIYWRETAQSVNVTGRIVVADDEENDRRFAEDTREVQASRVVSYHGRPMPDEDAHTARWEALYQSADPISRPDYWKWFRLMPDSVTFWEGHPERLNRRLHYALSEAGWNKSPIEA